MEGRFLHTLLVGSRLLLGQHEDPRAPKPPVPRPCPPAPGADRSKHPAERCPRLLSAPTVAAGAAGPMARPHGAVRFGDRSSFSVCTVLNPVGVRAVGKTGVSVSVCPCMYTAPRVCSAVRPSPYGGHLYTWGSPARRMQGWAQGRRLWEGSVPSFPGSDKAPAAVSGLALVGYFCFGSNQLCFHAAFRTKSKKSTSWFFFSP